MHRTLSIDLDAPVLLIGSALASSFLFLSESSPPACAPCAIPPT